jgi:hypothetical protein
MPTPTHARLHAPRLALTALALACAAAVQAQSPAPQRVEVTGSSIKRIDAESALPVQVIGARGDRARRA